MDNIQISYKRRSLAKEIDKKQRRESAEATSAWIQHNVEQDNSERWFPLTFRVDSAVRNAQNIAQSPWSRDPTYAFALVTRALDWTITELRRYHKRLQFVSWIGGNESVGVRTHIHAIIRIPDSQDASAFVDRLQTIWHRNLVKTLKTQVTASVWVDTQSLRSGSSFSNYASRSEAVNLIGGTDKVLQSKSLFLEPPAI
jgi:hypothetical protein